MTSLPPLSVLFADADLAATRPLRVDLRRRGAKVHLVDSADEAIRHASIDAPELLVLDDDLNRGAECGLLSWFRARFPGTEVVLLHSGGDVAPHGPGQGLLFSAHKPVSKETLLDVIVAAFPGRLREDPVPPPKAHVILCVDDDRGYLNSLSRFLRRRGYEVFCHESARRALQTLPEIRPELAIVDIKMPGMDGLTLTRRIREDFKGEVPVVVLTALDSKETYHRARESGASYCLTKPCKPEDFLNVVDFITGDLDEEERELLRSRVRADATL
jgi:DNA-binding response OmpR family regulator